MCEKVVLQCICLEMHLYVQAPFWSAVVAESTVMQQLPIYCKYISIALSLISSLAGLNVSLSLIDSPCFIRVVFRQGVRLPLRDDTARQQFTDPYILYNIQIHTQVHNRDPWYPYQFTLHIFHRKIPQPLLQESS